MQARLFWLQLTVAVLSSNSSRHQFVADPLLKEANRPQQFLDKEVLANPRYSIEDDFAGTDGAKALGVALDPQTGRVVGAPTAQKSEGESVDSYAQEDSTDPIVETFGSDARILELEAALQTQAGEKEAELERVKAQAFAEGQAQGQLEAKEMLEIENANLGAQVAVELRDMLGEFISEAQSHLIAHQDLFDPMKTLSLALAEQIARCELTLSDDSLITFIERSLSEVDPLQIGELVIHVSSEWHDRLQRPELQSAFAAYSLHRDESLQPGSVKLALQDASIHDLIEHRLAQLGDELLSSSPAKQELVVEAAEPEQDDAIFSGEFDDQGAIIQGDYSEVEDIFFQRPDEEER